MQRPSREGVGPSGPKRTATQWVDDMVSSALKDAAAEKAAWAQRTQAKIMDGNYLWQSGLASNRPATILDYPYDESEYAPSTFTSGLYVGVLGDWSAYWIVDCLNMTVQVVDQLYAATNQTGYIGRQETDGQPVDENAWVRSKLG